MIRFICLTLLFLNYSISRVFLVKEVETVAVVPFHVLGNIEHSKIYSHGLPDAISHRLSKVDNLKVLERLKLGELLQEIKLQECGLISDDDVNKIGTMLKADIIITATIHKLSSDIRFQVRGIRVSTGEVVFSILKYFTNNEFCDFSNIEYTISVDILKAIRPDYKVDKKIEQEKITSRSIDSLQKYCEGLYYFDKGENEKSKKCFQMSFEVDGDHYWVEEVRKEAKKMFRELNQGD